jgi:hypothetical protein
VVERVPGEDELQRQSGLRAEAIALGHDPDDRAEMLEVMRIMNFARPGGTGSLRDVFLNAERGTFDIEFEQANIEGPDPEL